MASLYFQEKDLGEHKRLERKGLELEIRKSECIEWERTWETSTPATWKEETIVEQGREKYYLILAFSFWKKLAVLCRVDVKGRDSLTQSNMMKNRTGEWYI